MKLKLCNNGQSVIGTNEQGNNVSFTVEAEEYKQWLAQGNVPEPEFTEEEIKTNELNKKIAEANLYLAKTDWVKDYKLRHDLELELIPESSSKWAVINKRTLYIEFLKGIK